MMQENSQTNGNGEKKVQQMFVSVVQDAGYVSQTLGQEGFNTYHILLALMRRDAFIRDWLTGKGVKFNDLMGVSDQYARSESLVSDILGRALTMATSHNSEKSPFHLLFSILTYQERTFCWQVLANILNPQDLFNEVIANNWHKNPPYEIKDKKEDDKQNQSVLGRYGTDYTVMASEGKLKPVIGRDADIKAIVSILARKDVGADYDEAINNPIITGPAGCGKSAIVKGLALKIVNQHPDVQFLWSFRVVYLSLGALMSNTAVRGSLEAILEAIIIEAKEHGKTLLFIDEVHNLVGLGQTEGSKSADELLKPALSEGLNCIGATTDDEFKAEIEENDSAFARRWIRHQLEEPNLEFTKRIVRGDIDNISRRHLVYFPADVIIEGCELARKFISYHASPHREIEMVFNGAGAEVKLEAGRQIVMLEDITDIIGKVTGMKVSTNEQEREKIVNGYAVLKEKVIGQDEACQVWADAILRFKSGMANKDKPFVILALGPTGVGKTYSAKQAANQFFHDRYFRLDMSEYMEKHTVSKLVGAPPGYVGYDERGQLTDYIRNLGLGIGLFDEIEKAHPDVYNVFLQLFDDGRLTDSHGNIAKASNFVFVMTSNIGAELYNQILPTSASANIGFAPSAGEPQPAASFEEIKQQVVSRAKQHFSPEFWNRIGEVVVYRPLTRGDMLQIADLEMKKEKENCQAQGFTISWDNDVLAYMVSLGYNALLGARPLKRVIVQSVQTLLAKPLIMREIIRGDNIQLFLNPDTNLINWHKA